MVGVASVQRSDGRATRRRKPLLAQRRRTPAIRPTVDPGCIEAAETKRPQQAGRPAPAAMAQALPRHGGCLRGLWRIAPTGSRRRQRATGCSPIAWRGPRSMTSLTTRRSVVRLRAEPTARGDKSAPLSEVVRRNSSRRRATISRRRSPSPNRRRMCSLASRSSLARVGLKEPPEQLDVAGSLHAGANRAVKPLARDDDGR